MIAYSYLRLSSKKQLSGHGRERQMEDTISAAQKHGWYLSDQTFQDLGVSGWKGANVESGAFAQFLQLVSSGQILTPCILICENPDRISRQGVNKSVALMLQLLDLGVQIYTITDHRLYCGNSETALTDLLSWAISAARGAEESLVKSERVGKARRKKHDKARTEGHIITKQCPSWLRLKDDRSCFEVLEEQAETVKLIFSLYADGFGAVSITHRLINDNIPPLGRSARWTPQKVSYLLRQESVTGIFQPQTASEGRSLPSGEPIHGYFPAIISKTLWQRVQAIRARTGAPKGRTSSGYRNIFRGLLRCNCGRSYVLKGASEDRVRCGSMGAGCSAPTWAFGKLQCMLLIALARLDWAALSSNDQTSSRLNQLRLDIDIAQEEISALKDKITNLLEAIEVAGINEHMQQRLKAQTVSLKEQESYLANLQQQEMALASLNTVPNASQLERIEQISKQLQSEEERVKANQYLRQVISSITLTHGSAPWIEHCGYEAKGIVKINLTSGSVIELHMSKDGEIAAMDDGKNVISVERAT